MSDPEFSIEKRIGDFIARELLFSETGYPYSPETSFLREGIIDSLGVMELVTFVQKTFQIPVDPAEVIPDNFDSITRLAAYVRGKYVRAKQAVA